MANVRFNRGLESQLNESITTDQLTVTKSTEATAYNSLYIGQQMIGTSVLRKMDPSSIYMPVMTESGGTWSTAWTATTPDANTSLVITADLTDLGAGGTASAITTARKLVNHAIATTSGYTPTDGEILTARAVEALITNGGGYYTAGGWDYTQTNAWNTWTAVHTVDTSKNFSFTLPIANTSEQGYDASQDTTSLMTPAQIYALATGNDIYHKSGTSGTNGDGWNGWVWTADAYKGNTLLTASTTPTAATYALSFTLPVHTWSDASTYAADNATLTTPYQVAQYLATFTSAMNYRGSLTSAMAGGTHSDAYQIGDVFIAGEDIASIGAEAGDMIIVNTAIAANAAFVSSGNNKNCDVFERNLDGAVTATATLTDNHLIAGTGNKQVEAVSYVTIDDNNSDIVIAHDNSHTVNVAADIIAIQETLVWHDLT